MDVLIIVFICLISVILIIGDIYLLAYFCHPDDRGFGSALICKIVVVNDKLKFFRFWALPLLGHKF